MILIFQRLVAHYRRPIIKKICAQLNAVCCFGKTSPPNGYFSVPAHDFPHEKVKIWYLSKKKDTCVFMDCIPVVRKYRPKVIVLEFALCILSNWLLLALKPFMNYKIVLWSHGYNRRKGFNPKKNFSDRVRVWWMNRADSVVVYGQRGKKLIAPHLKEPEKIFVAQNTLDTPPLLTLRDELRAIGKTEIKDRLGIKEEYNLIFIGRLLQEKQPGMALDVYQSLKSEFGNRLALHFVGAGPMEEQLKAAANGDESVYFWGEVTDDRKTGELLFLSDMMIMPGCLGLSVVHAFCFDSLVVTQKAGANGPFHGPEIEYVIDGQTGFLTLSGDVDAMVQQIKDLLNDEKLRQNMQKNISLMVEENCSPDKMIEGLKEALSYAQR